MSTPFDQDPALRPHGVSRFDVERFAVGEDVPAELARRIETHPELMAEVNELRGSIHHFAQTRAPLPEPKVRTLSFPRWVMAGAGLAAAAVALMVVGAPRRARDGGARPEVALKGAGAAPIFDVYVSARGEPAVRHEGVLDVRPGARLRFVLRKAPRAGRVAVVSLEASGRVSRFIPEAGEETIIAASGGPTPLPGTIEVDAYPGREWLVFVWAAERFELSSVEAALESLPEEALVAGARPRIEAAVREALDAPTARVEARPLGRRP
ncbi:MAG: hypothetical protein AAFU79_08005 [Myxococcota bacterium]